MRTFFVTIAVGLLAMTTACSSSKSSGLGSLATNQSSNSTAGSTAASTSTSAKNPFGGGGGGGSYCGYIRSVAAHIKGLQAMGASGASFDFSIVLNAVKTAEADAPGDIKPSWQVLENAIQTFVSALQQAGVKLNDLSNLSSLSPAQLQKLETASQQLDTAQLKAATDKIDADVKARCGIDISS